jgi:hypothetical protein
MKPYTEETMVARNIKRIAVGIFAIFMLMLISDTSANAQSRRDIERERQRIARENARYERDRQQQYYRGSRNGNTVSRRTEQRVNNANYSNGYEQGFQAGQFDRRKRNYNQSNVYRDTGRYPNDGDPTSSDYIYRQGYLQGYSDGYNGVRN